MSKYPLIIAMASNRISLIVLAFSMSLISLNGHSFAQEHSPDEKTLLLLHFNDSFTGVGGETPSQADGLSFEAGIFESSVRIDEVDVLNYFTPDSFKADEGTIEFWIRPLWNGNNNTDQVFISMGREMLLIKDGANNFRFIFKDDDSEGHQGYQLSQWRANEWHHIAVNWIVPGEMKTYVDGVEKISHSASNQDLISSLPTNISVGSRNSTLQADALFDELRISNAARSTAEIFKSFWNGIHERITITTLEILPAEVTIRVGGSLPFQAIATDNNDNTYYVASVANWTLTNPNVASVSEIGVVTANQLGQTTIFATINGIESNRAIITVVEPRRPPSLTVTPFATTVMLQWDEDMSGDVAAYNLYSRETDNQFGEPVRYVGPKPFYTDYNLQPGTQYFYRIASVDKYGNESLLSEEVATTTGQNLSQYLKIANLDMLIPIYTGDMSPNESMRIQNGMELAREFYFRNSKGQLNLNLTYLVIDAIAPSTEGPTYANVEIDLRSKGIRNNQYDAIHTFANNLSGCFGGFIILGNTGGSYGRVCGVPFPDNDPNVDYIAAWVFTHEFGHVLDGVIANLSGFPEMLFNHFPWAYPLPEGIETFDAGAHFDGMTHVLRIFEHHLEYASPWDGYIEVLDQDQDGLADSDFRVPTDEIRFGSNPTTADSDVDGLTDLEEFFAGIYSSSNPQNPDTDGDAIADGDDIYPITNFFPKIPRIADSVIIDGFFSENEKWHFMASNPFFSSIPDLQLSMYANWDDDYLNFAFRSNKQLKLYLGLDASGVDGVHTSPIKFPAGDYSSGDRGINENSFGDSYNEDAYLVIRYDANQVYLKKTALSGSSVSSRFENGTYTIESRIPHNIGPGRGWHYVFPNAPVIQEQIFSEDDVLGFELIARSLQGANRFDPYDWIGSSEWASMFELYHFYDATLTTEDIGTAVADHSQEIPSEHNLGQNFPNPFNPLTNIKYRLAASSYVNLTVYNALGQKVRTLVNGKQPIGKYQLQWDGRDEDGKLVSSGIYNYTLRVGNSVLFSKRMILLK